MHDKICLDQVNTIPELQTMIHKKILPFRSDPSTWLNSLVPVPKISLEEGAWGSVDCFTDPETGMTVVVKKSKKNDTPYRNAIELEIKILARVNHPNIISLVRFDCDVPLPWLATPYSGETLYRRIKKGAIDPASAEYKKIASGCLDALTHLHSMGIVHRDLKPENLVLQGDVVKVIDLGMAYDPDNKELVKSGTYVTTRWYRAPELFYAKGEASPDLDIYAMGIIFYRMETQKVMFRCMTHRVTVHSHQETFSGSSQNHIRKTLENSPLHDLYMEMLRYDHEKHISTRISAKEAKALYLKLVQEPEKQAV